MMNKIWGIGIFVWLNKVKPISRLSLIEAVEEVLP